MDDEWIKQALANHRCVGCGIRLGGAVIGLSIAWHPIWERVTGGETALRLTVGCGWCWFVQGVDIAPTRTQLLALTEQLYARIRSPSFSMIEPFRDEARLARDPRLRFEQPIGEAEVEPFLRLLKRTSFRRSSTSFQKWLGRLRPNRRRPP